MLNQSRFARANTAQSITSRSEHAAKNTELVAQLQNRCCWRNTLAQLAHTCVSYPATLTFFCLIRSFPYLLCLGRDSTCSSDQSRRGDVTLNASSMQQHQQQHIVELNTLFARTLRTTNFTRRGKVQNQQHCCADDDLQRGVHAHSQDQSRKIAIDECAQSKYTRYEFHVQH